jgi:hypothetical protein
LVRVQREAGGPAATTPAPNTGRSTGSGGAKSATSRPRIDRASRHAGVEDALVLQGSRLVTYDNNFNRRMRTSCATMHRVQLLGDAK